MTPRRGRTVNNDCESIHPDFIGQIEGAGSKPGNYNELLTCGKNGGSKVVERFGWTGG